MNVWSEDGRLHTQTSGKPNFVGAVAGLIAVMLSVCVECAHPDGAGKRWEVNLVGPEDANETELFF